MAAKIRKGDKVIVLSGRDKGRTGEVFEVRPDDSKALVRGVNLVKRHQKQTQAQEGGIISKEAPIHLSNIAIVGKASDDPLTSVHPTVSGLGSLTLTGLGQSVGPGLLGGPWFLDASPVIARSDVPTLVVLAVVEVLVLDEEGARIPILSHHVCLPFTS